MALIFLLKFFHFPKFSKFILHLFPLGIYKSLMLHYFYIFEKLLFFLALKIYDFKGYIHHEAKRGEIFQMLSNPAFHNLLIYMKLNNI